MFDPWLVDLIEKHARKGILVDANLMLIYSIGVLDPSLISKIDGAYSPDDFELLNVFFGCFEKILTTPNIMTEVSNLAPKRRQDVGILIHRLLRSKLLEVLDEKYVPTKEAASDSACDRLGISDAATIILANGNHLVLTNDFELSYLLHSRNIDCINYTHVLRPQILNRS